MADTFKKGDVVRHITNSRQKLVIASGDDKDGYLCSWITPGGTPREKVYPSDQLEPYEPDDSQENEK